MNAKIAELLEKTRLYSRDASERDGTKTKEEITEDVRLVLRELGFEHYKGATELTNVLVEYVQTSVARAWTVECFRVRRC